MKQLSLGIIGCGGRACGLLGVILKYNLGVKLVAVSDSDEEAVKKRLRGIGVETDNLEFYSDADEMLDSRSYDGVMIGTRCNLHTEMAIKVMKREITLYLEKPLATTMKDLLRLREAMKILKARLSYHSLCVSHIWQSLQRRSLMPELSAPLNTARLITMFHTAMCTTNSGIEMKILRRACLFKKRFMISIT